MIKNKQEFEIMFHQSVFTLLSSRLHQRSVEKRHVKYHNTTQTCIQNSQCEELYSASVESNQTLKCCTPPSTCRL